MRGMIGIFPSLEVQSRIKRAVKIDPISGCWVWQRTRCTGGYGQISRDVSLGDPMGYMLIGGDS